MLLLCVIICIGSLSILSFIMSSNIAHGRPEQPRAATQNAFSKRQPDQVDTQNGAFPLLMTARVSALHDSGLPLRKHCIVLQAHMLLPECMHMSWHEEQICLLHVCS